MATMIGDPRLVASIDSVEAEVAIEIDNIENMDDFVLGRMAALVDDATYISDDLRNDSTNSCYIAAAFMHRRISRAVKDTYPWKLARGNIDCNLRSLSRNSDGFDGWMTMKVAAGVEAGVSIDVLGQGVGMLEQVPWHTLPAEQGHGSHAVCHRLHPFVAEETLTEKP